MKLDYKKKKETGKNTNMWRLNNMLINSQGVNEKNQRGIQTHLESNENENTMFQNIRDTAKAVLKGKFIVIKPTKSTKTKYQRNNLSLHLKE